jgi:DNA-binding response OmpR family regulator
MSFTSNRRFQPASSSGRFIKRGSITLDLQEQRLILKNKSIKLPPCAFDYMVTLIRKSPEGVSYQQLVSASQGIQLSRLEAQDLARMRVYLLRKVIEENVNDPAYILAIPGYGYRFDV